MILRQTIPPRVLVYERSDLSKQIFLVMSFIRQSEIRLLFREAVETVHAGFIIIVDSL